MRKGVDVQAAVGFVENGETCGSSMAIWKTSLRFFSHRR